MLGTLTLGRLSPGDATSTWEPTTRAQRPPMPGNVLTGEGGEEMLERQERQGKRRDQGGETKDGRRRARPDCASRARGRLRHTEAEAFDWSQWLTYAIFHSTVQRSTGCTAQHSTVLPTVGRYNREAQPKSLHHRAKL